MSTDRIQQLVARQKRHLVSDLLAALALSSGMVVALLALV
jgi:hypothetical protein